MGIFLGTGQAMSPFDTPGGSDHASSVGRPESPAFFQYVCHSGWCVICNPTQTGAPGETPSGAFAISSARTCGVVITEPTLELNCAAAGMQVVSAESAAN